MASLEDQSTGVSTPNAEWEALHLQGEVGEKALVLERVPTAAKFSKPHRVAISGAIVATQFIQVYQYQDSLA